ncbi:aggrecan core protein-like isoform X1 [Anneissia japonica]|uniref:aggrecan core protein-like isoform X1 n=2 Tax=Anneissia japonica TaxID=1529436 RepID=UPI0014258AAF|nr:aggrecan core protein-like isoform X1 [Anneissia japonica]
MYSFAVLFSLVSCFRSSISVANTGQFVVFPQHVLLGWSQELQNHNRIQCLLACSRKTYCFSVNYNRQNEVCQLNKQIRENTTMDFIANPLYEYMEKVIDRDLKTHGIYFLSREYDYEDAVESCSNHLGSIASYEQLYNAFQPTLENCKDGWLISGEIAFTELTDACTLKPPEQRSNVFPCKSYESGVYCQKEYNPSALDYLPKEQRIIRLTNSNLKKLNAEDAEICCSTEFNGQLATPLHVYNNTLSLGVNLCETGWLSGWLVGNPCNGHAPPDFWLYPAGNEVNFKIATNEYSAFCFVPLTNQTLTYTDPFPSHRVVHGEGESRYSLSYDEADDLCTNRGGRMATRAEVEYAWQSGYDRCQAGWVTSGEVIYPLIEPEGFCSGNTPGITSWGFKDMSTYSSSVFCYL